MQSPAKPFGSKLCSAFVIANAFLAGDSSRATAQSAPTFAVTTRTPILVSANSGPGTIPAVNSLPPGTTTTNGFSTTSTIPGVFSPSAEALRRVSISGSELNVSLLSEEFASVSNGNTPPGASSFSALNEVLVRVTPVANIDAVLGINFVVAQQPGSSFTLEVDVNDDGSIEFDGSTAGPSARLTIPLPRFSTAPILILLRSSAQAQGTQASCRTTLQINLVPRGPSVTTAGCVPGVAFIAQPLLDGGTRLTLIDALNAGHPNLPRVIIIGSLLPSPAPLPFARASSCTLDVSPDIVAEFPQSPNALSRLSLNGGPPLSIRPFDISFQSLGLTQLQGAPSIHSSMPLTLRYN